MVAVCHTLSGPDFKVAAPLRACLCDDLEAAEKIRKQVQDAAEKRQKAAQQLSQQQLVQAAKAQQFRAEAEETVCVCG